jgi:hypothetical protein
MISLCPIIRQMSYKVGAKLFIEKGRKEKGKEKREYKPIG